MRNINYSFVSIFIMSLVLLFGGCSADESTKNETVELKVAAASDLNLAFHEVEKEFEKETGADVIFSFGSTGQLTDQIENGAPFDVFAAANVKFINDLREKKLIIPDTQTSYAFGRIGIASLRENSLAIKSLEDLLKPEVKKIAIANPAHAPYGLAAKQALEAAGIWEQLEGKLVYGRNISDTLNFIETGNAEAGIIALSLYQKDKMEFHLIDDDLHAPLEQSIAVTSHTKQEQLAREFIEFIKGPIGKPIMENYGFTIPEGK